MSLTVTLLSLLAFVLLTAGTAVFVAAEFSLTALERSTVDANARTGGRRDKLVQRAHKTLSFQLSGAQVGISITTLITGYLAEPLLARAAEAGLRGAVPEQGARRRPRAGAGAADRHLGVDGVRRAGRAVPRRREAAGDGARGGRTAAVVLDGSPRPLIKLTNGTANWILRRLGIEPAEELRSARSPQELVSLVRNSARSGSLDIATATLVDRSLRFGTRTAEELMTPRSKIEVLQSDDTVADLVGQGDGNRLLPLPDRRRRPRRDHRNRARQAGFRGAARQTGRAPGWRAWSSRPPRCRPPSTVTR